MFHLCFFHPKYPPWTLIHPSFFFLIWFQIRGVILKLKFYLRCIFMIVAEISPLHHAAGSQVAFAAERCDSRLHLTAGNQILPLHFSVGGVKSYCCMMQRGVNSFRCMMQWGVISKNFGRLSTPYKWTII
jgi:hypothetical protein